MSLDMFYGLIEGMIPSISPYIVIIAGIISYCITWLVKFTLKYLTNKSDKVKSWNEIEGYKRSFILRMTCILSAYAVYIVFVMNGIIEKDLTFVQECFVAGMSAIFAFASYHIPKNKFKVVRWIIEKSVLRWFNNKTGSNIKEIPHKDEK